MIISNNIKQKRVGGKCCSPVLLQGKIMICWAGKRRNIIMWTEGWESVREEGDEHCEQLRDSEIERGV
jgi:hypothetical protein